MKKVIFITAVAAAVMTFAASCGQNASNRKSAEQEASADDSYENSELYPSKAVIGKWKASAKNNIGYEFSIYIEIFVDGTAGLYMGSGDNDGYLETYGGSVRTLSKNADGISMEMQFGLTWYVYESDDGEPIKGVPDTYNGVYTLRPEQNGDVRTLHVKAREDADPLYGQTELKMEWIDDREKESDTENMQFLKSIFYKLPKPVMPDYMKNEARRRLAVVKIDFYNSNCLEYKDSGWKMFVYVSGDKREAAVIVESYDKDMNLSETTFKYNMEKGKFTEIALPIDPVTADEALDESHFDSPERAAKAKAFFNNSKKPLLKMYKADGIEIYARLKGYDEADEYGDQNRVKVTRRWDGNRFVKGTRYYRNKKYNYRTDKSEWIPYE